MIRRVMLSFVLASTWAFNVSADSAPPTRPTPLTHLKRVDPRVCFKGIEDYPDHVFFLWYYNLGRGNPMGTPPSLVEVKNSGVFTLNRGNFRTLTLLAMPRKDFDKRSAEDPSLVWLKGEPLGRHSENDLAWLRNIPDVLYSYVQAPPTWASAYVDETPVTEYRVTLTDRGRLVVEVLAISEPNFTPPLWRWPTWVAGIFGSAALVGAGVWYVRRRKLRARAVSSPAQESSPA